jgi:hypothetical protein
MKPEPTVYIDRLYDDDLDGPQPWPRLRRWPDDPVEEWVAYCEYGDRSEEACFDRVEEAIAWGRARAEVVFVRLGATNDAAYSAGSRPATTFSDGSGWRFPQWPPASWPDYAGPPEPGWPEPDVRMSSAISASLRFDFHDRGSS